MIIYNLIWNLAFYCAFRPTLGHAVTCLTSNRTEVLKQIQASMPEIVYGNLRLWAPLSSLSVIITVIILVNHHLRIFSHRILEWKGRERQRENHQCETHELVKSCTCLNRSQKLSLQPKYMPLTELNPTPFSWQNNALPIEPNQLGLSQLLFLEGQLLKCKYILPGTW